MPIPTTWLESPAIGATNGRVLAQGRTPEVVARAREPEASASAAPSSSSGPPAKPVPRRLTASPAASHGRSSPRLNSDDDAILRSRE